MTIRYPSQPALAAPGSDASVPCSGAAMEFSREAVKASLGWTGSDSNHLRVRSTESIAA